MDSFGEYLRRERELRGVTLEEISKTTNIRVGFLKALESDDSESLPAEVFVKGFIRSYAENTGMDHNEVLLAYNGFIASKREAQADSQGPVETSSNFNMKNSFILLIVAFVVITSLLVFYSDKKSREVKPLPVSEEKISQTAAKISVEESKINTDLAPESDVTEEESLTQPEDSEAKPEKKEISDEDDSTPPSTVETKKTEETDKETKEETNKIKETIETTPVKDALTLFMEAEEDAWISLQIDDAEAAKEALLMAGETARWKAKEKIVINLGNLSGTSLKLNDKDITLPSRSSNVLRNFTITLDNIKSE
jgi:cytoskeletal protein RodZ